jgi:hypothetical protein
MQVQAAIPEPRFNRFRCVHRDLVFRGFCFLGGPSDSDSVRFLFRGVFRGAVQIRIRFLFRCFAGCFAGCFAAALQIPLGFCSVSFGFFLGVSRPFETTVEFVQTKHTDSRALAHAITHNRIIKHTVTVPRSRTSETIA